MRPPACISQLSQEGWGWHQAGLIESSAPSRLANGRGRQEAFQRGRPSRAVAGLSEVSGAQG